MTTNRMEKMNRLMEVSLVINSTLQLEPLLHFIMDAAAEITEAEAASILLMDEQTNTLNFMAFSQSQEEDERSETLKLIPVPLQGSVAGAAVQANKTIVLNDVSTDDRWYKKTDEGSGFQTHSLLCVPMRIRDRVSGVLEAVNKVGEEWTEDDEHFLTILASQAAVAIDNSTLITKLRSAYDEISQLDKMKSDFIAIASHELRTPLGIILGYASFLKDDAQGEASSHAETVLNSAKHMRQIIDDMTNLRYLQIGRVDLSLDSMRVKDLMDQAFADIQSMVEVNDRKVTYKPPADEVNVSVDPAKMKMALSNVLNNAIKFTPKNGKINFGHELKADEIWITVHDEGMGIPEDKIESIFDEFFQVEDHMTRRHGGMGLGLSIARALVQAHNGRLWAKSPGIGAGSTFYISLPLA